MEFEDFFQILDHLGRESPIRVEVISLRLALHFLGLVQLRVTITTAPAQGLQLAQDVLKAAQRIVVLIRLWRVSVGISHAKEGYHRTIFAERSVTLDWLILLQADQTSDTPRRLDCRRNLLCGLSKKGMEEVRTTKSTGDDWWNLTVGRVNVD